MTKLGVAEHSEACTDPYAYSFFSKAVDYMTVFWDESFTSTYVLFTISFYKIS